jgi:hypothetical protein
MDHHLKKEIIILKLDFEKAFDMVEHEIILKMFQAKGFFSKWTTWIKYVLSSITSQVLLNQVPSKPMKCKKGVR